MKIDRGLLGNRKIMVVIFILLLCFMSVIAVKVNSTYVKNQDTLQFDEIIDLDVGWVTQDGDVISDITGYKIQGNMTIKAVLPENLPSEPVLFFTSDGVRCSVLVDGVEVGSITEDLYKEKKAILHNVYSFFRLPNDCQGKEITCQFFSDDKVEQVVSFEISNDTDMIAYLMKKDLISEIFTVLMLFFSLAVIVCYFLFRGEKLFIDNQSMIYLSFLVFFSNLWILTDLRIMHYLFEKSTLILYISFFAFVLIPVPFALFAREFCVFGKDLLYYETLSYLVLQLVLTMLHLFNGPNYQQTLFIVHICMLIMLVSVLVCLAINIKMDYKRKHCIRVFCASLFFFLFGAIQTIVFYVNRSYKSNATLFEIGLIIFVVLLLRVSFTKQIEMVQLNQKTNMYIDLLNTDSLTKLGSRAAFDKTIIELKTNLTKGDRIGFVMADLNNLKKTNDSKGHSVGDKLIMSFAQCVKNAYSQNIKSFRIGGDEFVSIIVNSKLNSSEATRILLHEIDRFNKENGYDLSVAVGYYESVIKNNIEDDVNYAFNMADKNMYMVKDEMRQKEDYVKV